jgi:hypothetical protein
MTNKPAHAPDGLRPPHRSAPLEELDCCLLAPHRIHRDHGSASFFVVIRHVLAQETLSLGFGRNWPLPQGQSSFD